jgi:flagellar motor switch protein FliG
MVLREVGAREVSTAMMGTADGVRERIFANVSDCVGTILKETMNTEPALSATTRQVVDAQLQ